MLHIAVKAQGRILDCESNSVLFEEYGSQYYGFRVIKVLLDHNTAAQLVISVIINSVLFDECTDWYV
jgi:hypothetical protein